MDETWQVGRDARDEGCDGARVGAVGVGVDSVMF